MYFFQHTHTNAYTRERGTGPADSGSCACSVNACEAMRRSHQSRRSRASVHCGCSVGKSPVSGVVSHKRRHDCSLHPIPLAHPNVATHHPPPTTQPSGPARKTLDTRTHTHAAPTDVVAALTIIMADMDAAFGSATATCGCAACAGCPTTVALTITGSCLVAMASLVCVSLVGGAGAVHGCDEHARCIEGSCLERRICMRAAARLERDSTWCTYGASRCACAHTQTNGGNGTQRTGVF